MYAIALDEGVSGKYFLFFFFTKKVHVYVLGTHQKCLEEALLMSTQNIYFNEEIRKTSIFCAEKKKYAMIC